MEPRGQVLRMRVWGMMRLSGRALAVAGLTLLTQVGGLAWLLALWFRRRWLAFPVAYAVLWGAATLAAPHLSGRVPLPCFGEPLRAQSPLYCLMLRNFVTPALRDVAQDAAARMAADHPGTVTLALDGNFPFLDGFPLIPHLSHDDGDKLDLAFFHTARDGTPLTGTRSPLGYFAFEGIGPDPCPPATLTLRWDLAWLQPLYPDRPLDRTRTAALIRHLLADPRVGKVFVEPPLATRLGLSHPNLRFQGCRAARHDDHIHIQL